MDTVVNVFIYDRNEDPLPGAEVKFKFKFKGRIREYGPVTSVGLQNKPVVLQLKNEIDEPFVDVFVGYDKQPPQERRIDTRTTRDVPFSFNVGALAEQKPPAAQVEQKQAAAQQGTLQSLISLLDKAVAAVPRIAYVWGVVGIGAAAAIINAILGLGKVAAVSIFGVFFAMLLVYLFTRLEDSQNAIVKLCGYAMLLVSTFAFAAIIGTGLYMTFTCKPQTFVYLLGLQEACKAPPAADNKVGERFMINSGATRPDTISLLGEALDRSRSSQIYLVISPISAEE